VAAPSHVARLAYGSLEREITLPGDLAVRVPTRPTPVDPPDPLEAVAAALDAPIGAEPLARAAAGLKRVTVVVPDATRPTPPAAVLWPVLARLARAGVRPEGLRVVVARGLHAPSPRDAVERIVGAEVMATLRPVQSAADLPDWNAPLLVDEDLGEVRVHRHVADAELVVLVGIVQPHHLAGFGGGAKTLVPGTADRATIVAAHALTMRTWVLPDGSLRRLEGVWGPNAFRDALVRVARAHGRCWALNLVLDERQRLLAATAGEVGASHEAAAALWTRSCAAEEPVPADLVLAGVGGARATDLIQAHKALQVAAAWAKADAPIVWLAAAPEGPGHPEFLPWFETGRPERHLAALRKTFHPYGLTAYGYRQVAARHPVHVVSEVAPDILRGMGLLPAPTPQIALSRALEGRGVLSVAVLSDARP
jgi:nickel-dependent lactate racemase